MIDALVVWKLDRLGRSLKHLIDTVNYLPAKGVEFVSLQESVDTSTSGGKPVFHVFGALAEFERELIRERMIAGLKAARPGQQERQTEETNEAAGKDREKVNGRPAHDRSGNHQNDARLALDALQVLKRKRRIRRVAEKPI